MQPCPRVVESPFRSTHGSSWREDRTCSYCGSIDADLLFQAIQDGRELGPTDKNYKVYVDLLEEKPEELRVVSAITHDPDPEDEGNWVPADPDILKRDGWSNGYRWMRLTPRGVIRHAKFYFYHLSQDQMIQFVDLMNNKKLKIGYPGHFYVLPYFVKR